MRICVVSLITLVCVSLQTVQLSWAEATSPKIGDHEITVRDVLIGGVAGQIVLDRALNGVLRAYFHIEEKDFEKASAKLMSEHPEKVLYITSYSKNDPSRPLAELRFKKRYGSHPNAHHLEVLNPADLISKLKAFPQDSSFDRIEINMHGNGGVVGFADGTLLARHDHPWNSKKRKYFDVQELINANLRIAAPGADLRLTSCSVADDLKSGKPIGKDFLNDFGKGLLPHGGQVFSSEKVLVTIPLPTKAVYKLPILGLLEQAALLAERKASKGIPERFRFRKDVVQVSIPSRESSCALTVMQTLQKALQEK